MAESKDSEKAGRRAKSGTAPAKPAKPGKSRRKSAAAGSAAPGSFANRAGTKRPAKKRRVRAAPPVDPVLPWGSGLDRVRAMAVDPMRLFVYWEVTDDAIAEARRELGSGGSSAALVLRVYDTSGRLFDGTNAHSYFDHEVARGDRQWFFDIGKPASDVTVEVGLRTPEHDYAKIARSGKVSFPRCEYAPTMSPRWLTVYRHNDNGQLECSAAERERQRGRFPYAQNGDSNALGRESIGVPDGRVWKTSPQDADVAAPEAWTEDFVGEMRVERVGPITHVEYGPWEVVIRGLGAYRRRRVLCRWEIYRSWVTEEGLEARRNVPADGELMSGSSARLGASEWRWPAGSELRLAGASELVYRGASERRFGGASELLYQAASERIARGASERRLGGASERARRGASERRLGGASEAHSAPTDGCRYPPVPDESDSN